MIKQKLRDAFGNHYIIQLRRQNQLNTKCKPLTFLNPQTAYHFIMRLHTPSGYWLKALRSLSISPSQTLNKPFSNDADDNAARLISQYLCHDKLFIYTLTNHKNMHTPVKAQNFEQKKSGKQYTFNHPSVLLTSNNIDAVKIPNKAAAEALLMSLLEEDNEQ
ncbi:hypothetical protein MNBD_GAMMA07-792 [hydrothermal vent metagenome]|uniref:Uncharacterized protein n=1 Tax=hydrothermal vent metagenome TaxID=652676 RepID=A0A3B0WNK3_9ZZZZ